MDVFLRVGMPLCAELFPPRSPEAERFSRRMFQAAAVLLPLDLGLAAWLHVGLRDGLAGTVAGALTLAAVHFYCRWRRIHRLAEASEMATWAVIFTWALSVLIQLAGRAPMPLADRPLAALDGSMHFSAAALVSFVARLPLVQAILALIYAALGPLILAALLLPPLCGRSDASRRFIVGVFFAGIVTAVLFALLPAVGPWTVEAIAPSAEQARITSYMAALRSPGALALRMDDAGIVSFPSFHVLLAVLIATALGELRWLRIPAWLLAALVVLSTLTTGWHYLTDVLGGLALAALTVFVSRKLVGRLC